MQPRTLPPRHAQTLYCMPCPLWLACCFPVYCAAHPMPLALLGGAAMAYPKQGFAPKPRARPVMPVPRACREACAQSFAAGVLLMPCLPLCAAAGRRGGGEAEPVQAGDGCVVLVGQPGPGAQGARHAQGHGAARAREQGARARPAQHRGTPP